MIDYKNITTPTECELVIALADIAHFARSAETMSELALFDMLSEYYELTGAVVEGAGGKVVKFMGDAALIVFAGDAPDRALEGLRALKAAADERLPDYDPDLRLLIMAHVGPVVCGPLGTATDKRFDVIGKAVNELFLMGRGDFVVSGRLQQQVGGPVGRPQEK